MVIVDSSVWIDFFRGKNRAVVEQLGDLLDQDQVGLAVPVRLEILTGARRAEVPKLRRVLSALPLLVPTEKVWSELEQWVVEARDRGERFAVVDLLIAAIAREQGASVWSLDLDFRRMAALGFAQAFVPKA